MAFRPSSLSGSPSSLAPILRRRARCSNAKRECFPVSYDTQKQRMDCATLSSIVICLCFFLLLKLCGTLSSLLHALFFLISSVTRATSAAARAFDIANQLQARLGCPCKRWGFRNIDFLSVDQFDDVAVLSLHDCYLHSFVLITPSKN